MTLTEISGLLTPRDPADPASAKSPHPSVVNRACIQFPGESPTTRRFAGFEVFEVKRAAVSQPGDDHLEKPVVICRIEGGRVTRASSAIVYLPAGAPLRNVLETGARYLIAAIHSETLKRSGLEFNRQTPIRGLAAECLRRRLLSEFYNDDALSLIALEGILLELLAELGRGAAAGGGAPPWLRAARNYTELNCFRTLRLGEIAGAVGVHKVHLAREFRRHYSMTIGEFITRRRLEECCRLLAETENPLADIATACGYSDQSHFGAIFRRNVGLTPTRFRNVARASNCGAENEPVAVARAPGTTQRD